MTVEFALAIVVGAAFCCYLVWKWQEAVVDMADPPYQEPIQEAPVVAKEDVQAAWPFPISRRP